MAAIMVKEPPHCGQAMKSMAKTRLSNWAQLMRARVEAVGELPCSLEEAVAWSASPGTIWDRRAALGASTPWKRMRWSRRRGTRAARTLQAFQRAHDQMGGAIAIRGFELEDDFVGQDTAQPLVLQGRTGDVAAQPFEGVPLLGPEPGVGMQTEPLSSQCFSKGSRSSKSKSNNHNATGRPKKEKRRAVAKEKA